MVAGMDCGGLYSSQLLWYTSHVCRGLFGTGSRFKESERITFSTTVHSIWALGLLGSRSTGTDQRDNCTEAWGGCRNVAEIVVCANTEQTCSSEMLLSDGVELT